MSDLGDRMKLYESRYAGDRFMPLLPVVARMDGRNFSKFCKNLRRPFDPRMSRLMIETTRVLLMETNARLGYTQSDEITLVWYSGEFEEQIWFDARVQKMVSHLAATTSLAFNYLLPRLIPEKTPVLPQHAPECYADRVDDELRCVCGATDDFGKLRFPSFDARVWDVPNLDETCNAVLWREQDATKNSIQMAAQKYFSQKQLHGLGRAEQMDLLHSKGVNWNDYPTFFKRGSYLQRKTVKRPMTAAEAGKLPEDVRARYALEGYPTVKRSHVITLDIEPLAKIPDRVNLLFGDHETN